MNLHCTSIIKRTKENGLMMCSVSRRLGNGAYVLLAIVGGFGLFFQSHPF